MGMSASTQTNNGVAEIPPLGEDKVSVPKWAGERPPNNPKVFFDIEIGGTSVGRIEMTLAADVVPRT